MDDNHHCKASDLRLFLHNDSLVKAQRGRRGGGNVNRPGTTQVPRFPESHVMGTVPRLLAHDALRAQLVKNVVRDLSLRRRVDGSTGRRTETPDLSAHNQVLVQQRGRKGDRLGGAS